MQRTGKEAARPQKRKTLAVEPMAEMRITVVTWNLSIKEPSSTAPKTEVVFARETVRVEET